eukprot:scaffold193144_cov43-Tisochrysis_lutea.AAC.1
MEHMVQEAIAKAACCRDTEYQSRALQAHICLFGGRDLTLVGHVDTFRRSQTIGLTSTVCVSRTVKQAFTC